MTILALTMLMKEASQRFIVRNTNTSLSKKQESI